MHRTVHLPKLHTEKNPKNEFICLCPETVDEALQSSHFLLLQLVFGLSSPAGVSIFSKVLNFKQKLRKNGKRVNLERHNKKKNREKPSPQKTCTKEFQNGKREANYGDVFSEILSPPWKSSHTHFIRSSLSTRNRLKPQPLKTSTLSLATSATADRLTPSSRASS